MDKFEKAPLLKRKIHIISIGNQTMCDLAIALKEKGYEVSGSDVTIEEPFFTRLKQAGLLPEQEGWHSENINKELMVAVPAMHINKDNPELIGYKKAGALIMSFPEFIFERAKDKTRVVIAGSKNRMCVLSIILNVLKMQNVKFDYVIQHPVKGFDKLISFDNDSRIVIIEGDEFAGAAIEKCPMLQFYRPHIALINTIDKTMSGESDASGENYFQIFKNFVDQIERNGKFIYNQSDENLQELAESVREDVTAIPYDKSDVKMVDGQLFLESRFGDFPVKVLKDCVSEDCFFQNVNGARLLCRQLGIQDKDFYTSLSEYTLS
ncbi:MAG: Mur ligase domain-containing protein [Candidatus Azobacteroides sp.]|nr:Mur ligase domain-containing protein [Candidatus Azobacteroides sp.]